MNLASTGLHALDGCVLPMGEEEIEQTCAEVLEAIEDYQKNLQLLSSALR